MSLQEIAEDTFVSKRSIYNDIYTINEWLKGKNILPLEVIRGKGIEIPREIRESIEGLLREESLKPEYVFSPTERVKVIICYLISSKHPLYVNQLMEYFQISRNTVFGDLRIVSNRLEEHELKLWYDGRSGYIIKGDTVRSRALFTLIFNELKSLYDKGVLTFMNKEEIAKYFNKLKIIEKALGIEYVEGKLLSLGVLLSVIHSEKRSELLTLAGLKRDEIKETKEYILINKYFTSLPEEEKLYLCLHMLGTRLAFIEGEIFDDGVNAGVQQLVKSLVSEFERIACVSFNDRDELEKALYAHINTSMYRYQYGIQIEDCMSEDIIREYPNLFEITKVVSKKLEQMIGLPIVDGEVALLALHFGSRLTRSEGANPLRILIVCINGMSTGNMLKQEIQQLLPHGQVVGVVSKMEMLSTQDKYDLIISTVNIKSEIPIIVVRPILSNKDREQILNHKVVEKSYGTINKDFSLPMEEGDLLATLIMPKVLIINDEITWQESIYLAGEVLVGEGSIEREYLDCIVAQILQYGSYMFLTDSVMLAHGRPEDGVNKMDVSLTVFKKPPLFPGDNQGKVVFLLAAEDQNKHLNILKDILKITTEQKNIEMLLEMESPEDIVHYLRRII
jgi:transcriptional antiterminator/mannitol/fructose-specific phosphotransferase system IIA component (Ntr-type)